MDVQVGGDRLEVTVPTWRGDLEEEMDLVEEVLRFYGYDRIPASLPRVTTGDVRHDPVRDVEEKTRDLLVGCGLTEVVTLLVHSSRVEPGVLSGEAVVTNALTENLSTMRLSAIPGLLDTAAFNRSYGTRDGALFEVGRTYHPAGGAVRERAVASIALFGSPGAHWGDPKRAVDFFDLKGFVEELLGKFHLSAQFIPAPLQWAKPGKERWRGSARTRWRLPASSAKRSSSSSG